MKKILVVGLLTLAISPIINVSALTFAATKERGTTWWSVEEMLDFYQEVEQEKTTECGHDEVCRMEFNYNMIEKGPKYSALNNFLETQLWVTSVNPAEETVKVFYFDDDVMLKRMGIEEKIHLQHLYMGWFDEWNAQIFNYDHERFTSGEMPGLHTMYDGSSSVDGSDWIPAWKEAELSVAGSNLKDNHSGIIDYAVFAEENKFNAQGTFNYSNCLKAPDYTVGVECKLMISGDQWATYLPPREDVEDVIPVDSSEEAIPANPSEDVAPTNVTNPDSTADSNIVPSSGSVDGSTVIVGAPDAPNQNNEIAPEGITGTAVTPTENQLPNDQKPNRWESIKAPNTGMSMSVVKREVSPMPWWLVMMELLGGILMLWWFIPVRAFKKQKKQKSPKKSPKSLDKKSQVR